ncbi:hypothetical protein T01_6866 [Trichinella spiralis]|uniref:Uncharacterized protein n=1 Tax=Trichinella spiralis TaxID=6334 RepID=A0A0V1B4Q9_TRISP|nr:hypothetical protein T01_6866 [Trichinella spiralis]
MKFQLKVIKKTAELNSYVNFHFVPSFSSTGQRLEKISYSSNLYIWEIFPNPYGQTSFSKIPSSYLTIKLLLVNMVLEVSQSNNSALHC